MSHHDSHQHSWTGNTFGRTYPRNATVTGAAVLEPRVVAA